MTKRDVKDSLEPRGMFAKRFKAPKVPKIIKTSPPKEGEGPEKYSLLAWSAIGSSCETKQAERACPQRS